MFFCARFARPLIRMSLQAVVGRCWEENSQPGVLASDGEPFGADLVAVDGGKMKIPLVGCAVQASDEGNLCVNDATSLVRFCFM